MTYNVYYANLRHWDKESNDFGLPTYAQEEKDEMRKTADHMGFLLMYVHLNTITEDNIEEIIFRLQFADTLHGSPYLKKEDGSALSIHEIRRTLTDHIGLETNMTVSTRHKFIVNVAKNKASDIDYKLREALNN